MRPMFPDENIHRLTDCWAGWEESVRKNVCLCLTDTSLLESLDANVRCDSGT